MNGLSPKPCVFFTSTFTMPRWGRLAVALGAAAFWPHAAAANFAVCNQTLDVVNVAIGQWNIDDWETSGWWTVGPNQCANVIEDQLTARFVYVYARDVFNNSVLEGATELCVAPEEFFIRGQEDCVLRGYLAAPYLEVDTRKSERWTVFLTAED